MRWAGTHTPLTTAELDGTTELLRLITRTVAPHPIRARVHSHLPVQVDDTHPLPNEASLLLVLDRDPFTQEIVRRGDTADVIPTGETTAIFALGLPTRGGGGGLLGRPGRPPLTTEITTS